MPTVTPTIEDLRDLRALLSDAPGTVNCSLVRFDHELDTLKVKCGSLQASTWVLNALKSAGYEVTRANAKTDLQGVFYVEPIRETPVNDHPTLTHQAIGRAIEMRDSTTLLSYACECLTVGADGLAEHCVKMARIHAGEPDCGADAAMFRLLKSGARVVMAPGWNGPMHGPDPAPQVGSVVAISIPATRYSDLISELECVAPCELGRVLQMIHQLGLVDLPHARLLLSYLDSELTGYGMLSREHMATSGTHDRASITRIRRQATILRADLRRVLES